MSSARSSRPDSTPEADALLAIARLGRPHGVRGEVRAEALCPPVLNLADLLALSPLWLRRSGHPLRRVRVVSVRPHPPAFLLVLDGWDARETVAELAGTELCLERSVLPELPEGWYWEDDLIGLVVEDRRLGVIGRVAALDVIAGQGSLRVVSANRPGVSVGIPWVAELVRVVDLEGGRVEVDLPLDYPGLS
jgi:16S rRNA processing protein RimM